LLPLSCAITNQRNYCVRQRSVGTCPEMRHCPAL